MENISRRAKEKRQIRCRLRDKRVDIRKEREWARNSLPFPVRTQIETDEGREKKKEKGRRVVTRQIRSELLLIR